MLPLVFCERMRRMLGQAEYETFLKSYDEDKYQGLRFNIGKGKQEDFLALAEDAFSLEKIPWAEHGFYYGAEAAPGKHAYHEAGVYYMQEPSAMAPAAYLQARPGERVLDLCAAPGGKTTQIAAQMRGEGLLVTNEIHPARVRILSENVERMGVRNALVTNAAPADLRRHFGVFFHRIMVDAPCSGEGMFRKQEMAVDEWSLENVRTCAARQDEILEEAYAMLLPGGRMVYSTCTFAPDENEGSISRFLAIHSDMHLVEVPKYEGMSPGRADWYEDFAIRESAFAPDPEEVLPVAEHLERSIRLWPHLLHGEGHFVAVMEKDGACPLIDYKLEKTATYKEQKELQKFAKDYLTRNWMETLAQGQYLTFGEQLYLVPKDMPTLKGLKVLRPGLHLGTLKKNRFEPSHAWALTLYKEDVRHVTDLSSKDETVYAYLRGETFTADGEPGWHLITVDGYALGWGKLTGTTMKNHYPKGLRITYK